MSISKTHSYVKTHNNLINILIIGITTFIITNPNYYMSSTSVYRNDSHENQSTKIPSSTE